MTTRRSFLRGLGAGAGALAGFAAVREAAAESLARVPRFDGTPAAVRALADQYLLDPSVAYLNHASIGTTPSLVHEARRRLLDLCETNPWLYMWEGVWEGPREVVRTDAARLLGADLADIALTHNTTEGFNLLAQGLPLGPGDEVLFSSLNHAGASVCWRHHAERRGFTVKQFPFPVLDLPGMTPEDVAALYEAQFTDRTRVLVISHIENTLGLKYPVRLLAERARARGVLVAVDGAQSLGMIPVDVKALGVDMYAASPHKWLQAPKGTGLLYVSPALRERVEPMWMTWGQAQWGKATARRYEDYGTRNLPEVLALGDAITFQARMDSAIRESHHRATFERLRDRVEATPSLVWRSPRAWDLGSAVVAIEVRGSDSAALAERLWTEKGVVLRAFRTLGLNTVRLSPNVQTDRETEERFFRAVT